MSDHRRHHHHQGQQQPQQPQQQPSPSPVNNGGSEDFKCNICLSIASDAVVTLCGHLFCWPCLYTWLHFHSRYKECPVCKGTASETKLIPIYSWGTKDAAATASAHGSDPAIPPRPSAKRVESERQRRQRYHGNSDRRRGSASASVSSALPNETSSNFAPSRSSDYLHDISVLSRETRASWLERLRAMREERLAWPIAFVQGLTSRELVQQRRQQAREAALSSRLMVEDSTMHDSNDLLTGYCQQPRLSSQPGLQQYRSLPLGCSDHILSSDSSSHTAQYLSTMSSILSSMEVFAKALELSSSSSLRRSAVAHPAVFHGPDEEQALWQSSMRALLAQMERLMVQLQSIQPRDANDPALIGRWHLASNHRDGSMTERSHGSSRMERELMAHVEGRAGNDMGISPQLGRFEVNANLARVAAASQCHRSVFSLPTEGTSAALEHTARGSKSRKRWDVTRMSR